MTSFVAKIASLFGLKAEQATKPAHFREAVGATVDADEEGWRKLSGDTRRDLDPMTQERMQKLSHYVWETNLLGNRLIELPLAYLLAKGVRLSVADEELQPVLDRHWTDGINCWAIKLIKRARELALFGEQCWPVFVSGKMVRVGYLDPRRIATVVMDPDNAEQPIGIVTTRDRKGVAMRYRVIVNVPETAFTERTQAIRQSMADGDAFFFRVNDLCNGSRGRSDILSQIDWLDAYDEFLFGELDRAAMIRAFVWDLTLKGADQPTVDARAKKFGAPKPGSAYIHNEQEELKASAPVMNTYDAANGAKLFRNHILGGATMPEHWYGGAGDVNRATGSSMAEPTEKLYEMRQSFLGYMLCEVGRYVIRAHWDKLDDELDDKEHELLATVRCEWPEMTTKDTTKFASALASVVSAAASALAEGLMTRETAISIIAAIAKQLGVEIDVEDELKNATAEHGASGDAIAGAALDDETLPADPAVGASQA